MRIPPLLVACVCPLALACGRLGFEPRDPDMLSGDPDSFGAEAADDASGPGPGHGAPGGGGSYEGEEDDDAGVPSGLNPGLVDTPPNPSQFSCDAASDAWRCSTFDDPALTEWDRIVEVGGTVVAADGALVSSSRVPFGRAAVFGTLPETTSGDVFLRAQVLVPSNVQPSRVVIARIGHADLLDGSAVELAIGAGGKLELTTNGTQRIGGALTPDRWLCVQLHIELADQGRIVASIDETPSLALEGIRTNANSVNALDVGIAGSGLFQLAATVLVDDVAIGPSPLGCRLAALR